MRVHESVMINRPPDEVWAFVTDFFNSPRVRPGALAHALPLSAREGREDRRVLEERIIGVVREEVLGAAE